MPADSDMHLFSVCRLAEHLKVAHIISALAGSVLTALDLATSFKTVSPWSCSGLEELGDTFVDTVSDFQSQPY